MRCRGAGSNRRHRVFQTRALPTELPRPGTYRSRLGAPQSAGARRRNRLLLHQTAVSQGRVTVYPVMAQYPKWAAPPKNLGNRAAAATDPRSM